MCMYVCMYDVRLYVLTSTPYFPTPRGGYQCPSSLGVQPPSPVRSERTLVAARIRGRRMTTSLHARCVLLGSAAKKKPLRLTQEPADAVLAASVDAATAAAGGVRSWADAKTWAPSLVLILDRKARLATGQPSSS